MEDFWSAPPVARLVNDSSIHKLMFTGQCLILMNRTWTAATLATSVLVYGRMINGMRLIFSIPLIFKLPVPEVWRILSSFCITGADWAILYDTYFREYHPPEGIVRGFTVSSVDIFKQSREGITAFHSTRRLLLLCLIHRIYHSGTSRFCLEWIAHSTFSMERLIFLCCLLKPRNVCPLSYSLSCSDSWYRGRLPLFLHVGPSFAINP